MGIVQIGCGLVAFTAGSRHLPAADLALLAQTEVVLSPVWAWLVVGEVPAFWTLVGGAMVLAAVTLQAWPARGAVTARPPLEGSRAMTPSLPSRADVVIIGGGIVGCSIAYHLTKLGITESCCWSASN